MEAKIVEKAIDEIIPYDKNPRRNDEAVPFVKKVLRNLASKFLSSWTKITLLSQVIPESRRRRNWA